MAEKKKAVVINTRSFSDIKVDAPCKKKLFEIYKNDSFIVVLDKTGAVVLYERKGRTSFKNLRDFISLFGSDFFKGKITNTGLGKGLMRYYESLTNVRVRDIYKYKI